MSARPEPLGDSIPRATGIRSNRVVYTVAVLFVVNLVGYLDRQILSLLVQPIKASLSLTDGEVGLMQGMAFVLTYSFAGLFIGRLVDRRNRRNLLIACVTIWSISAAASGLAQAGWQLFLARMGVGVGEAALLPTALSLISDSFVPERRGKALGVFMTGVYVGIGLSLVLVGFALPAFTRLAASIVIHGKSIDTWRLVMVTMLIPGAVCCALLMFMREPERSFAIAAHESLDWSGLRDWVDRLRLFIPHHLGFSLTTLGGYALTAWLPTVLIREHALDARMAGLTYGAVVAVAGCSSAYLGGVLGDWRSRVAGARGRIAVALHGLPVALAGYLLITAGHTPLAVLTGAALATGGLGYSICIGFLSISDLAPAQSRGQITAIYLICTGLIGFGGGPAAVGYANDLFGNAHRPLSTILGIVGMAACIGAFVLIRFSLTRLAAIGADGNKAVVLAEKR